VCAYFAYAFEYGIVGEVSVVITFVSCTRTALLIPGRCWCGTPAWQVVEPLEAWTHPHHLSVTFHEPAECRRYRLKVQRPLPWRTGRQGEFATAELASAVSSNVHRF
jgi:hypothetical protein